MSSLYKTYLTDKNKEREGVEFFEAPNEDGSIPTFIIARQGGRANKEHGVVMRELAAPHQTKIDNDKLEEEVGYSIARSSFIRGCLKGWKNVKDQDKNEMPFTVDNAEKLFKDLPDLFERLNGESLKLANFRVHQLEEEAKN